MGATIAEPALGSSVDSQTRRQYEDRLRELQDDIDEAERSSDHGRSERARLEFDLILAELTNATGLGGRTRTTGGDAERARSAVTQRIRASTRRIGEHLPDLGTHLRASIKTGMWCSYDPEREVEWNVSTGENNRR